VTLIDRERLQMTQSGLVGNRRQGSALLLNHLIGDREHASRYLKSKRLSSLDVNCEAEFGGL